MSLPTILAFSPFTRVCPPPWLAPFPSSFASRLVTSTAYYSTISSKMTETTSGPYAVASVDIRMPPSVTPSFRARLFYPTIPDTHVKKAEFFPPSTSFFPDRNVLSVFRFAEVPAAPLFAAMFSYIGRAPIPAQCLGEIFPLPSDCSNGYPVMIFSHGLGGAIGNYSNFCAEISSHGYVVCAPEHTDGSAFEALVGYEDTYIPYLRYNGATDGSIPEFRKPQLDTRCDDITKLLIVLHKLSATDELDDEVSLMPIREQCRVPNLKGMLDVSNVIIAGHSFGSATTLLYASRGLPRPWGTPKILFCLDAWLVPLRDTIKSIKIPNQTDLLFIDMAHSNMVESLKLRKLLLRNSNGLSDDETSVRDAVEVIGGLHNNASDFPLRTPKFLAVITGTTKKDSDPLQLLQAQNLAAVNLLRGLENWKTFRDQVSNQREESLGLSI